MKQWQDKGLYWANGEGPTPTQKSIDYVEIIYPNTQQSLAIGVWNDDKYTPMNRDELAWHINHGAEVKQNDV